MVGLYHVIASLCNGMTLGHLANADIHIQQEEVALLLYTMGSYSGRQLTRRRA